MHRILAIVLACLGPATALADTVEGRLASGLAVTVDEKGAMTMQITGHPLLLDDGRRLVTADGNTWKVEPPTPQDIKTISAIDFSVYGADYVGKVVRLVGAKIVGAEVAYAQLVLPGSRAKVDLEGAARDVVKRLVETCSGFLPSSAPLCNAPIIGTVQKQPYDTTHLTIADPVFVLQPISAAPAIKAR